MEEVPRHAFVPAEKIAEAYVDHPIGIGEGQTISQPFMVAAMADALALTGSERVLEIGAGSGYQAAVLSRLAGEVIAVERHQTLARTARERLARLGYSNARVVEGDGSLGLAAGAPYDAILVSAAAPSIPKPLLDQLAENGRVVIPLGGSETQRLRRVVKSDGKTLHEDLYYCRFVPLVGVYGWPDIAQGTLR